VNDLAQAAVEYLTAGLHVLALVGKRPNTRVHGDHWSYEDSFHGAPKCIEDANAVRSAFSPESGTTGIAICIPPGMLVADVDTDRAAECLLALGFRASDETVAAQTKNGIHVWFWHPDADRNWWAGDGRLGEFKDNRALLFKGLGGYVVAPPSDHLDERGDVDGHYTWISPLVSQGMVQMPDALPERARAAYRVSAQNEALRPEKEQAVSFEMQPDPDLPWWQWPKVTFYATSGLERAIESAADGNQNNVIHWAAMTCREEGVPYEVAVERLMGAAERGGHPKARARDTIRGAYKRNKRG
jgi:hypothetical protein